MGYQLTRQGFDQVLEELTKTYRVYAPVLKEGEGRYTDVDVVRYDFVSRAEEIELEKKSDYSFKEYLLPLSETLFYFTEDKVTEASVDQRDVIVLLRSCDMHAVKRLDHMYLQNGQEEDWFYRRLRDKVKFALIGCGASYEDCFCVDMGSNRTEDGYAFSVDMIDGDYFFKVEDNEMDKVFAGVEDARACDVEPRFVTENEVHVDLPESLPISIYKDPVWDEYTSRCINCGRCTVVCPTCTCYTMQDIFYTDNGKVGERRRINASCMINGYTDVAGGGQYRKTNGERMRFKVLHKIQDFRARTGYNMCVGCGRCDMVCPEYISFSACINKVAAAGKELENDK